MKNFHRVSLALRPSRKPTRASVSLTHFSRSFQTTSHGLYHYDDKDNPLSDEVRSLMRRHPQPLAALVCPSSLKNAYHPEKETAVFVGEKPFFSGILLSSLTSVSLYLEPIISFNIRAGSTTLKHINQYKRFTLTGISNPNTAAALAHVVRERSGQPIEPKKAAWKGWIGAEGQVKQKHGGTWWMQCKYRGAFTVHVSDHKVIFGEVTKTGGFKRPTVAGKEKNPTGTQPISIVRMAGQYRKIGRVVWSKNIQKTKRLSKLKPSDPGKAIDDPVQTEQPQESESLQENGAVENASVTKEES